MIKVILKESTKAITVTEDLYDEYYNMFLDSLSKALQEDPVPIIEEYATAPKIDYVKLYMWILDRKTMHEKNYLPAYQDYDYPSTLSREKKEYYHKLTKLWEEARHRLFEYIRVTKKPIGTKMIIRDEF